MPDSILTFLSLVPLFFVLWSYPYLAAVVVFLLLVDAVFSVLTEDPLWWFPALLAFLLSATIRPKKALTG